MSAKATIRSDCTPPSLLPLDGDLAVLLRQAEQGNCFAFERIAWRYDEALLQLFLRLTASERESRELYRATLVSAFERIRQRESTSLYIWLYQIAAEHWLEYAAKRGRESDPRRLSARERLVFVMKASQRLSLKTIAQILQTREDVLAETFLRAVGKLR